MHPFENWYHRHLADNDPTPEPASPPPFQIGDRVVVLNGTDDSMFIGGAHGEVIGVEFTADEVFGPWLVSVLMDESGLKMAFGSDELRREIDDPSAVQPTVVEQDEPVPYVPTDSLESWIQRANELRHETVFTDTPVYDDVVSEAMSADGLAAEVEAWLAAQTDGAA